MTSNQQSIALHSEHITKLAMGLHFDPATPYDEWEHVGRILWTFKQWVNWAIGDWLNFGERVYGESYAQAIELTGWEYDRLTDCAWVAKAVPFSVRNENLSWTHHRHVARFADNPEQQTAELAEAYHYGFTTREFYNDLKERYPPDDKSNGATSKDDEPTVCPTCRRPMP